LPIVLFAPPVLGLDYKSVVVLSRLLALINDISAGIAEAGLRVQRQSNRQ